MSLAHAILGILQKQPMTGYDLKTQYFDQSIAHFWPADQAQIYRTLDKMAEQGWVEAEIAYQEGRPNRKVYSITEAGRAELWGWLITSQPLPPYREPFLVQLFLANDLPDERLYDLLDEQIAAHQARLTQYSQIPLPPLDDLVDNRALTLQRLTLELGFRIEQSYIDWLKLARETIQHLRG